MQKPSTPPPLEARNIHADSHVTCKLCHVTWEPLHRVVEGGVTRYYCAVCKLATDIHGLAAYRAALPEPEREEILTALRRVKALLETHQRAPLP